MRRELSCEIAARGALAHDAAPAFCLSCAEYFSRGDGLDWWTWDGVKRTLGLHVSDDELRDAVQIGMGALGRRVLVGGRGREYLATLVSEGGLPLTLLQREGARLRNYFADLLRQHETYPTQDLRTLATELAAALPVRMQNAVVYDLASTLIREIARIRGTGIALHDIDPSRLPLRIESDTARALLNGLHTAPRPAELVEIGIVVRTTLRIGAELVIRRELGLPVRLSGAWLERALDVHGLPPRIYLSLQTADGIRQTAGVATLQGDHYIVREIAAAGVSSVAVVTEQIRCVASHGDGDLGSFVPKGGEALSTAPWTFDDEAPRTTLRSSSNWRSRAATLLVALPAEGETRVSGTEATLGTLRELGRNVVRLEGSLTWWTAHDVVTLATRAQDEPEVEFQLRGERPPVLVRETDLWLGPPDVVEVSPLGTRRTVAREQIVWRRPGEAWSSDVAKVGSSEMGVRRGTVEFRARVRVLPADLRVALREVASAGGVVEVRSELAQNVGVAHPAEFDAVVAPARGGFDLRLTTRVHAERPAVATIWLKTRTGAEVSFTVPFPAERVAFVDRRGAVLSADTRVAMDDLVHLRAVAVSPTDTPWSLDACDEGVSRHLGRLQTTAPGVREIPLEALRPALSAILAAHSDLDHVVRLKVVREGTFGRTSSTCTVQRYGARLEPRTADARHHVALDPASAARLGATVVATLRAEAVPLYRPDLPPTALPVVEPGVWSLDDAALAPGPWLVLGYQNDYLCTRPLRLTIPGVLASMPVDSVLRAMAIGNRAERESELDRVIATLPDDTTAPGWTTLRAQLGTLGRYPASTFDAVRSVTRAPRIAVLSLLDAGVHAARLWSGLEELPFSWATLPIEAWIGAIGAWVSMLASRLPAGYDPVKLAGDAARGVLGDAKLAPFLACVHEAAFLCHKGIPEPRERWILGPRRDVLRNQIVSLLTEARNGLLQCHGPVEVWPTAPPWPGAHAGDELAPLASRFEEQPWFKLNVLTAPLLLAERVVAGDTETDPFALRQVREFDSGWFDQAFAFALSFLLGRRYERKEHPFHE